MKYPIGCQTFSTIIEKGMVYVDKTDLIYDLAQRHVCFCGRPRRFGKSLMLSTLKSYFLGKKELFRGLKIEQLENDWIVYPVLHLDFANGGSSNEDGLQQKLHYALSSWEEEYGLTMVSENPGIRFEHVIREIRHRTGQKVVVLVDEYDKPLLDVLGEPLEQQNREILKNFYGTFKTADEHLQFVMLTGVTKFSQVSVFSGFNQPEDISQNSRFDALCGITDEELHQVFDEEMEAFAAKRGMRKEDAFLLFKRKYDGYHFSEDLLDVYNPFSVLNALSQRKADDYWFATGTPTYLLKLIDSNRVNIQQLLSIPYERGFFMDYRADVEKPLPMLYQSGYLTIKDVDNTDFDTSYWLGFPNAEVEKGMAALLANNYFQHESEESTTLVKSLAQMLRECRLNDLRDTLTAFFGSIPYGTNQQEKAKDYESHYHYTLYLIFRLLSSYIVLTEKQNSRGRADIIVETNDYVFIFEFKLDASAQDALDQIEQQGYAEPYLADKRQLVKIGVAFSSEKKNIAEWKTMNNE